MKKFTCVALSALLLSAPLTACGSNQESYAPPAELPPLVDELLPETPNTPEQPTLPEEPTTPDEPSEPPKEETTAPTQTQKPSKAQYILIHRDGLNVRTGASTAYTSLGQIEAGVLLQYVRTVDGWYETYFKNRVAYVSASAEYSSLVSLPKSSSTTEKVIDYGLRYMGVPYVYGATRHHDGYGNKLRGFTEKKFDCSSLMQYIFYLGAGELLQTTTRTQILQGKEVKGELKRGDLLFFTNSTRYDNVGVERVGHVALYLGGNYILHTASDYAKIEQISNKRWSYYLSARRFFE